MSERSEQEAVRPSTNTTEREALAEVEYNATHFDSKMTREGFYAALAAAGYVKREPVVMDDATHECEFGCASDAEHLQRECGKNCQDCLLHVISSPLCHVLNLGPA